jgi:hypothetical protein
MEQAQSDDKISKIDINESDSQSSSLDSPLDEHISGQKGMINNHIQPQTRSLHF